MNWLGSITVKPGNFISKPSCHSRPSGQALNSHPLLSLWVWTSLRTAGAASPTHHLSYEFKTNKSSPQISEGSWDTRPRLSEMGANLHACQETLADFQVCGRGSACHGFFSLCNTTKELQWGVLEGLEQTCNTAFRFLLSPRWTYQFVITELLTNVQLQTFRSYLRQKC